MKNIIKIFRDDIKDISSNIAVLILVIGLSILPSLYAWFNIKACWDPYGNTANLNVAVVNNDRGTTLFDKKLNVGDKLVDKLKANHSLGWKFVGEEEAKKGVETGKYYASIEITEDFSKDIVSVLGKDITKGEIIYTVNEKLNAIAPKITDKGATTIQTQINQSVVKTASEAAFEVLNKLGITLEKNLPKLTKMEKSLVEVQGKFGKIESTLDTASSASDQITDTVKSIKHDMPMIKTTIKNSMELSKDVKEFLQTTKSSVNSIAPTIKNDLKLINSTSTSVYGQVEDLTTAVKEGYENAPELIDGIYTKVNYLYSISSTLGEFLTKINQIVPGDFLGNVIDSINSSNRNLQTAKSILSNAKEQIKNGEKPSIDNLNNVLTILNDVSTITGNILNNYNSQIVQPLNNIFDKGITVSNDVINVLEKAEQKLPNINNILDTTLTLTGDADETIDYVKTKLPEAKSDLDEVVSALSKVNNSEEMNDLISFLKNDVIGPSNFFKDPVKLVSDSLYPVESYGEGLTPFYTILAIWVGVLLLTSLLTTEVHGDYKPYQVYFGRGLTFLSIALIQSLIVSLGDVYILGVKTANMPVFISISLLSGMVFTFIVYSLVSVFGNVGKALAIILLVIQVAGSGGTYPIQLIPEFFQRVNPFLPFTYGINGLREAVAGIYQPNLTKDIIGLLVFLVLGIVLNVLLKGPINKLMHKFNKKMSESRLVEH
ncbi:YhgE/Pip family protein [Terrisporobacter sp.]